MKVQSSLVIVYLVIVESLVVVDMIGCLLSILAFISFEIVDSLVIVDILRMTDESTITRSDCILILWENKEHD